MVQPDDGADPAPGRGLRIWANVVLGVLAVLGIALATLLIEFFAGAESTALSASAFAVAAVLTYLSTVLIGTYYEHIVRFVAGVLGDLPGSLRRRIRGPGRRPWPLLVGLVPTAVLLLVTQLVEPLGDEPTELEPGRIRVLSAFDESPRDPRRILIDQWNQSNPDNQVEVIDVPNEPDAQFDRFAGEALSGADDIDVFVLDTIWTQHFIDNRFIRPLDLSSGVIEPDAFFENSVGSCMRGGEQAGLWCVPLNSDAGLQFHRTGLPGFEPPTSWDDCFGEAARATFQQVTAVPDPTVEPPAAASALQLVDDEILTVVALEAIWAFGGEVVNRDGVPVLSSDSTELVFDQRAEEALVALARAFRDREITLPDADIADEARSAADFAAGRALCMRNWPVAFDNLTSGPGDPSVAFDVRALPYASALGGQNLAVAERTTRPRAAQAFVEFLTSSASQLLLFEVGGFAPARLDVYDVPAGRSRPYVDELRRSLVDARPRPISGCYVEFSRMFREGLLDALQNDGALPPGLPADLAVALGCTGS